MSSIARSFRTPGRAHSAKRRTCRPAAAVLRLRSVLSLCSPAPLLRPPTARRAPRRYTAHVKQTRASDNKVLVHYDGWSSRYARRRPPPSPPAELLPLAVGAADDVDTGVWFSWDEWVDA